MTLLIMKELLSGLFFALLHGVWSACFQPNMPQEKNQKS